MSTTGTQFAEDVMNGLSKDPKSLPCVYFYDERGSRLFERICDQPEYYPTDAERRILRKRADDIAEHYERREYSKAMRRVMALADAANRYIDDKKPWVMAKDESQLPEVQDVCTQGLNLFRSLMVYLTPVIPAVAAGAREFLGEESWSWESATTPLLGTSINKFKPLLQRVDPAAIEAMVEQSKDST